MMLRQRLAIAADTPNLIPMPTAHAPPDRSTRQIAVRPYFRPLENRRSHSSNPHRSQRRNRAPSGPRFRAFALLGRLSWERVDGFVMQASEKPAYSGHAAAAASSASASSILSRNVPSPPAVRRNFFVTVAQEHALANLAERVDGKSGKRQKYSEADKRGEQNGQNLFGHQRRRSPTNTIIRRPDCDREHERPSQSAEVVRQYVEAHAHQHSAKKQPRGALLPRRRFCAA